MTIKDILDSAQDYRGERCEATLNGDSIVPHNYSSKYNPYAVLRRKLGNANRSTFPLSPTRLFSDCVMIPNTCADGMPLLSDCHTEPDAGAATWSNREHYFIDYTKYLFQTYNVVIKNDTNFIKRFDNWWFAIDPFNIAIHYKVLSDKSFELEFMNPHWIRGYMQD